MKTKEDLFIESFKKIKEPLNHWGNYVVEEINRLISQHFQIEFVKISPNFRLKSENSIVAKAFYRGKNYANPINDIEDKIGCRIVLLKSNDVYDLANILEHNGRWQCKVTKDISKITEANPKVFDYQSVHLVVWPLDGDEYFNELDTNTFTCEVQIRTLLQHAFAEVSHDSTYKGPYKNDSEILRKLSKSMALMEATDDYFCTIFELISSQTREFGAYKKELDILFESLFESVPIFYDIEFLDIVFELLLKEKVEFNELEQFVGREEKEIREAINSTKIFAFHQPAILLLYYYIVNKREFLIENLQIDHSVLETIFVGFGHSIGTA